MDASIDTLFGSRPTSSVPLRLYIGFKLRIIKELGLLAAIVEKLHIGTLFIVLIGLCIGWADGWVITLRFVVGLVVLLYCSVYCCRSLYCFSVD